MGAVLLGTLLMEGLSAIRATRCFTMWGATLLPCSALVKFRGTRCVTIGGMANRRYELKRRAEQQHETRCRIVDATIELHETIGPAATTFSDIAERAGGGRVTVYRPFPDERT